MFFSEVVNSSIFICAGDSLWKHEKIQFFFNFFFVQILTNFVVSPNAWSYCQHTYRSNVWPSSRQR
jgi:hypothetical protein